MRRVWQYSCILALCLAPGLGLAKKSRPAADAANQADKNAGFEQLFNTAFTAWDSNHDGKLDLTEINAAIDSPAVTGNQSAIAAVLHRSLVTNENGDTNSLSWDQVHALADDPGIQKQIHRRAWHINSFSHALFFTDDPNLESFRQGGMGDCYLLAAIAGVVRQNPRAICSMIQPTPDGGYAVHFADGSITTVGPMTDGEMILGSSQGDNHGYWLSVLEKAYAERRQHQKEVSSGHESAPEETLFSDIIGHGGTCGPAITAFTGHRSAGAPVGRWYREDPQGGLEKTNALLTRLFQQHRVITVGTGGDKTKPLPHGIPHKHALAVVAYDPVSRMVTVFNPWGNHVKPTGPPGLVNGYETEHGLFQVPLAEFVQIFGGFTYESDTPVSHKPSAPAKLANNDQ